MISQDDLKDYEFRRIENYFDYITESVINGNFSQAKKLFHRLGKTQKTQALKYFYCPSDEQRKDTLKFLINNEVIL